MHTTRQAGGSRERKEPHGRTELCNPCCCLSGENYIVATYVEAQDDCSAMNCGKEEIGKEKVLVEELADVSIEA